ncbi:radical SAM/SPASM domain-containing protein [Rhizohabitans arisaemae]|uniref:radical SAM/SPASM domain-containing protein n=1 Tax=Rhizohabitans arisaemae TaxID=2720610 RepID=UPI0024B077F3|nr:radical SAM/SPASM domain-containing protein [Rhizohabitans arisaemae]
MRDDQRSAAAQIHVAEAGSPKRRPMSGWWLEFELTGRCQLTCAHCYADSGPGVGQGSMTTGEWRKLIAETAALGVTRVQLIGGEPTAHPDFPVLLAEAVEVGLMVEVYSNLIAVRDQWWDLFRHPLVSLATSYYSDDPAEHARITGNRAAHARTMRSIVKAVRLGIPVRAGIVAILAGQRIEQAQTQLRTFGVTEIVVDRVRRVGRAAFTVPDVSQLCGRCGERKATVGPSGDVWPCVLSRWMVAGNVRTTPLEEIVGGDRWRVLVSQIPRVRSGPKSDPELCDPVRGDGRDCHPSTTPACNPKYDEPFGPPPKPPRK